MFVTFSYLLKILRGDRQLNVAMFSDEQNAGIHKNRSIEETAGIQTGLAPDIEAHLMRRRNRKPPPDDLAEQ